MFAASKTASVSGGYQISRSLRFNSADSAYLSRTPATAGNRKTWTWSVWIKRGKLVADADWRLLESRPDAGTYLIFDIPNTGSATYPNTLRIIDNTGTNVQTTPVFRDPSAWYHIVLSVDTTQATASNRLKIYVNNLQVTSFVSSTYPTQNLDTQINTTNEQAIGRDPLGGGSSYYDGLMTETNLIDGQALTPSSFGEINAQTGVWQAKKYLGTYGTNGFYLNFSDNSNTTAATLGKDYSGNGNNWTPNNFSVTAGIGNDSLTDTPTNNFATLDPLQCSATYVTLSNGNLQYVDTTTAGSFQAAYSTMYATSGKYYFEATIAAASGTSYPLVGSTSPPVSINSYIEKTATGYQGYGYVFDGTKATNDTYTAFGAAYTAGDTVSVAVDIDAGKVWFAKNGTWQASGDPATGANSAFNIVSGRPYGFAVQNGSSASSIQADCNFGQRAFLYSPPSGFNSLCTNNLPTPTIGATTATQAGKFFNTVLWTGNGSNPRAITGVGFQPDFSWLVRRDIGYGFWLYDAVRGATKVLNSNSGAAEGTYQQLNSFDSDGFTQAGAVDQGNNISGGQYEAWNWKANGAGVTNTAGSITSTVSANTTSGFSVVTYSGGNLTTATIGHGLGVAPSMIILKRRNLLDDWRVYHVSFGATQYMDLNTTSAAATASVVWGNTTPTSSVFTVGNSPSVNTSGGTYVAYCFAEVAGYSKFGSYTGNGSTTEGVFIYTGFQARYIMFKLSSGGTNASNWSVFDTARSPFNMATSIEAVNTSLAEYTTTDTQIDILANGIKIRSTATGSGINQSGVSYIFAAFAETPFKYALAR